MEKPESSQPAWAAAPELVVTDPAAIEVLWYPTKRVHLKPFLGKACDLAGATAELGIKKTAMSYWINRLLEVGLIRQTHVEKRTRHRVPFYRCVADRLRVDLKDAPLASYEGVFDDFQQRWGPSAKQALAEALAHQAPQLELCYSARPPAGPVSTIMPKSGEIPPDDFIYYWARFWLSKEESRALHQELDALWEKYAALSDETRKTEQVLLHLVHVQERARTPRSQASAGGAS
jgi:hypothetical protein